MSGPPFFVACAEDGCLRSNRTLLQQCLQLSLAYGASLVVTVKIVVFGHGKRGENYNPKVITVLRVLLSLRGSMVPVVVGVEARRQGRNRAPTAPTDSADLFPAASR